MLRKQIGLEERREEEVKKKKMKGVGNTVKTAKEFSWG